MVELLLATIRDQSLAKEEPRLTPPSRMLALAKDLPKLQHTIRVDRRQVVVQMRTTTTTTKMVAVKTIECIDPIKF